MSQALKALKNRVRTIDIHFEDLVYEVDIPKQKKKKTVLNGLTGTFKSGHLTAIMGPSGAGKSSLLNILTGFTQKGVSGTITFGEAASKSRKLCCYIVQDDHFYSWFTVEETMMFAATLKISDQSLDLKEKKILIEYLLETLHLSTTKKTRCGNLSGGQRKRLSIALELIDNPAVLFLDEPTTGLDSSSSVDTIQLLQNLASEGRTIICTIHQPSTVVYNLFNQIYVMNRGLCTYQGTPMNTVDFLRSVGLDCPAFHNPADFLMECVNCEYGDFVNALAKAAMDPQWHIDLPTELNTDDELIDVVHRCKQSEMNISINRNARASLTPSMESTRYIYPPPEWMRLWLLIGRCHVQFFRDWTVTHLKLGIHILCAILIGLFYGDSGSNATKQIANLSSYIIHIVYLWYTTLMPSILRFPQEINIIKKETFNNWYKLKTYYLAALITSTPVHIIFSTVYATITFLLTDQLFEIDRYVKFILAAIIVTICADSLGILIGTMLNPVNGTFIGAIITCFMLIYSGFLILLNHMSNLMRAVSYLSPLRYALESMILSMYDNNRPNTFCPPNVMYCHFKNPSLILRTFDVEHANYSFNILMIVLILTIFKGTAYFTLKHKIQL